MTTTHQRDTESPAERPRVACSFGSTVGAPRARRGHLTEAGTMKMRRFTDSQNGRGKTMLELEAWDVANLLDAINRLGEKADIIPLNDMDAKLFGGLAHELEKAMS